MTGDQASTERTYHLTEEQVAEVERRLAEPNAKILTLEEVRERFARRD